MASVTDILNIARGEIGYREGANNNSKYGAEYGMNYNPWCVMFLWWCFKRAGASDRFYGGGRTALCSTLYNFHKGKGQAVGAAALQPGDIVFFDFSGRKRNTSHVGIVESVSGSSVVTIEGNTSSGSGGSQSNGDGVYRRTRSKSLISCAYRPAYDGVSAPANTKDRIDTVAKVQAWLNADYKSGLTVDGIYGKFTKMALVKVLQYGIGVKADGYYGKNTNAAVKNLRRGSTGTAVRALQGLLVCKGFRDAYVDGEFGDDTKRALIAYQNAVGLSADGIAGKNTFSKLCK